MMIEDLLSAANLNKAYQQVTGNRGASGIDRMETSELGDYLKANGSRLCTEIREGAYRVSPILGVEIPKPNGKKRLLGIPTVVDRVFQQALHQVLEPLFEPEFRPHSYGFRPGRNARQAIAQSLSNINSGYQYVVDIDLKSFFDEVEHYILLELIYRKVSCAKTLKLLRSFLRAPISINGKLQKRRKGVPQGSPLSPLLSNILLNELDKELEKRQLRYVRYADDFGIYVKSRKAARRVGNGVFKFLKEKLKLPINKEKSGIRRPVQLTYLGFGFVPTYKKGEKGQYQLVVEEKKWASLKQKLKTITRKTTPASMDERIQRLNLVVRGWVNYFKPASIQQKLKKIDEWLRNRLRYCIWHHWKDGALRKHPVGVFSERASLSRGEKKRRSLIRLGVKPDQAYAWSRTRMKGWKVAQSPILGTTITVARLEQRGYLSLQKYYEKVRDHS